MWKQRSSIGGNITGGPTHSTLICWLKKRSSSLTYISGNEEDKLREAIRLTAMELEIYKKGFGVD